MGAKGVVGGGNATASGAGCQYSREMPLDNLTDLFDFASELMNNKDQHVIYAINEFLCAESHGLRVSSG